MAIAEELKVIITADVGNAINNLNRVKKAGVELEQFGKHMTMTGRKLSLMVTAPILLAGRAVLKYAKEQEEYKDTFAKFSEAMKEIAKPLADIIVPVLDKVATLIKNLADWFNNLDPNIQKTVTTMLAIAAAIGPILMLIGPLISGIGTLIGVFTGVNTVLSILTAGGGPIGLILIAIAALAAATILIIQNWGPISEFFTKLWNTVKDAFVGTWEAIKAFVVNIAQEVFAWLKENWPMIVGILGGPLGIAVVQIIKHWDDIKDAFQKAFDFIKDIVTKIKEWLTDKLAAVIEPVRNVAGAIKDAFLWLKDQVVGHSIIPDMVDEIDKELKRLGPIAQKNFEEMQKAMQSYQSAITPFADAFGEMVINAQDGAEAMKEAVKGVTVSILQMIAKEAFARATLAFATLNIPQGIALSAAGTAALLAAGVVKAMGEGGIVTGPTTALIGEKGPEAVIPLNRMSGMGGNITIIINGSVMEEEGLARRIGSVISRQRRGY